MTPTDIHQKAIALLNQLPPDRLTAVVQLLEFLAQPARIATDSEEAELLQLIQQQPPDVEQSRLQELRDRCEWGQLSEAEQEELLRYEDLLEQQRVERLAALIKLAKLRNVDLITLNRQLQPESRPFYAA